MNSQLNDKFNSLLKKIENQKKDEEYGIGRLHGGKGHHGLGDGQDTNDDEYNKDRALKELFDDSVEFKNSLAQLRSQIKTLNGQFN